MRQPIAFGKYLLLERISVGGMAEVFKAKSFGEEGFEKILAIKRILPSMAEDEEFIQMFIDEAKISGQLSHPNICQIYELGKIAESHFIAMEFVWGKDVLQIQNRFRRLRQKVPLPMAAYVVSRVCEGLDYAHRKKDEEGSDLHIVHRDVSPQNVLVSYAGEVKLIDFGIAKARSRSSKTQAGVLKGKFGYMSPEQVRGLPLDQRSDVFAAGTLLYEMTTGERLFTGESDFATLEKVRNSLVPQPSKVDPRIVPALEAIIMTALRRDPDERYASAAEMQEELTAFLMTQNPIFNAKTLATTMGKMFEAERKREEDALHQYLSIRKEDLESFRNSPEARREAAVSLLPKGRPGDFDDGLGDRGPSTDPGAPIFAGAAQDADGDVLTGDDLLEVEEEEEEARSTRIFTEEGALPMTGPVQPEQMSAEPTFIFNAESGQLVQLAEQSTVIFSQEQGENGGSKDQPDQGPTVIFDANLSGAVAGSSALPPDQISGTMPVAIEPSRGSLVKDILIGVLVALVLILGIVLWKVFSTQDARTPATATVVLTTTPPLPADVLIDGVPRGRMEPGVPLTIKQLAPQAHQILVRSPGVPPVEEQVVLAAGDVRVLSIKLELPRKTGHLVLGLDPPGAHVFIDGSEISETAAAAPIELRAGAPHEVRVSKEGFRDTVEKIEIQAGERLERKVVLMPLVGATTKVEKSEPKVEKGEPKVAPIEKPEPKVAKVEKPEPKVAKVAKVERPEPKVAKVARVEKPEPKVAKVAKVEKAEPKVEKPEPKKVAKVEKPEPKVAKVSKVEKPEPKKIASSETSGDDPNMGFLVANTVPWAKVLVDGKDTGKTTPVAPRSKIPLKPGRHKVTFVVDGKQFHFPITVSAGQITRLIKKLEQE